MLFAANEPVWFVTLVWSVMCAWFVVHVVSTVLVGILIHRLFRVTWEWERDRATGAEQLAVTNQLLTVLKGWALVVEHKEQRKDEKIQQVADTAAKTAVEMREVVADAVKATAAEVVAVLDQRAAGESGPGTIKSPGGP